MFICKRDKFLHYKKLIIGKKMNNHFHYKRKISRNLFQPPKKKNHITIRRRLGPCQAAGSLLPSPTDESCSGHSIKDFCTNFHLLSIDYTTSFSLSPSQHPLPPASGLFSVSTKLILSKAENKRYC